MKPLVLLISMSLLLVSFQNCGGPNGLVSSSENSSNVGMLSLNQLETIHLQPEITERMDQQTGQIDGLYAPEISTIELSLFDQSVQKQMATRIYGPFEGKYSYPMIFEGLQSYQYFGFYIEKSTLSGSDLEVRMDDQFVELIKIPVTTDGKSVSVESLFWIKLNQGARKVELKIVNHVGVVRVLDYIISKKTPEDLQSNCMVEAKSYCRAFLKSQTPLNF